MHIRGVADLHGNLPDIEPCDLLLIAGDLFGRDNHTLDGQAAWLKNWFRPWLKKVPAKRIVGICGNHDWIGQTQFGRRMLKRLPWNYLEDEIIEIGGLRIYGSPWTPPFRNWAFMMSEERLDELYYRIPPQIDIALMHGPPYGILDKTSRDNSHVGSKSLKYWLQNRGPSKALVCGHIHEGRGNAGICWNVSMVDDKYVPHMPASVEIII